MPTGQVTINDSLTKSKIHRFCEKKIDQWVRSHFPTGDFELPEIEFKVSFEESDARQISCTTEVQLGNSTYRGWDLAADTQMAFIHSLKRLEQH